MNRRHVMLLLVFLFGAVAVTLSNRYLTFHFNALSQNAYRFLAGGLLLLGLASGKFETVRELLRTRRDLAKTALCGALIAGLMWISITAMSGISAVTASVLNTLQLPMGIGLAMAFFADERSREPRSFAFGLTGLLIATGAYVWFSHGRPEAVDHLWAIGLFLLGGTARSGLMLVLKDVLRRHDSLAVACVSAWVCILVMLTAAVATMNLQSPTHAGPGVAVILIGSGLLGIWVGTALNNELIHTIGVVRLHTAAALVPPGVAVAGWVILGESVSIGQVLAGLAMLLCVMYLTRLKHGTDVEPDDVPVSEIAAPDFEHAPHEQPGRGVP